MLLDDLVDDFTRSLRRRDFSPCTLKNYNWAYHDLVVGMRAARKWHVSDLTRDVLEDWQDSQLEREWAPRSRSLAVTALRQLITSNHRPRLLDLFCGAGGAAMGYHRAGFEVVGVDIVPQPHYPFEFILQNALWVLEWPNWTREMGFDAIHASPPCQAYAEVANSRKRTDSPALIEPMRALLNATGLPWIMENVPPAPMPGSIVLCGSDFELPTIRHRRFEANFPLVAPLLTKCPQRRYDRGVYHGPQYAPYGRKNWGPRWRAEVMPALWPWMTIAESGQAVPPPYTEWIGKQLLAALEVAA